MFERLERKRVARETEAKMFFGEHWDDATRNVDLRDVMIRRVERDINYSVLRLVTYQPWRFKLRALWRKVKVMNSTL